jgi:hypothetical protein
MGEGAPEHHPAASHVAKYLIQQIESGAATTTLHALGLLKEVLATFPKQQLKVYQFVLSLIKNRWRVLWAHHSVAQPALLLALRPLCLT